MICKKRPSTSCVLCVFVCVAATCVCLVLTCVRSAWQKQKTEVARLSCGRPVRLQGLPPALPSARAVHWVRCVIQ